MKRMKQEKGSIAVYVSVVVLSMLFILFAVFLTSSSKMKTQIETTIAVKQSYEADNAKAGDIYNSLVKDKSPQYVSNGLVLHYDAINNTGSGHNSSTTTWKDLSGNGNDGTLSNTPNNNRFYWENNSLTVSGNSSGYGQYYVDTPLNLSGNERTYIYTIDASNLSEPSVIWSEANSSNLYGMFNRYNFVCNRGANSNQDNRYTYSFNRTGIYSYAISLSSDEMKFYQNGVLVSTVSNTVGLTCQNNIRLLASRYTNEYNQNVNNLKLYNFMAYERALTDNEIQQNYNIDKERYGF